MELFPAAVGSGRVHKSPNQRPTQAWAKPGGQKGATQIVKSMIIFISGDTKSFPGATRRCGAVPNPGTDWKESSKGQ